MERFSGFILRGGDLRVGQLEGMTMQIVMIFLRWVRRNWGRVVAVGMRLIVWEGERTE
jgi:hypothetical protein